MKKIKFVLQPGFHFPSDPPSPAINNIPEWYRKGESFINNETMLEAKKDDMFKSSGMKGCMPFFDSITSGYLITTWSDIEITKNENNNIEFRYVDKDVYGGYVESVFDPQVIVERTGDLGKTIPRPEGHAQNHFAWSVKWGMKLPRGWSMLVTHPMNRFDLPFVTTSAIMDSDRFSPNGNMPFFLRDGWTGIIEKGTPIAQLVPIKRSSWISTAKDMSDVDKFLANSAREVDYGFYRSRVWIPKRYRANYDKKK